MNEKVPGGREKTKENLRKDVEERSEEREGVTKTNSAPGSKKV